MKARYPNDKTGQINTVLGKNPLDDIANIRSVTLTVKRGMPYRRDEYRPIARDEAQGEM